MTVTEPQVDRRIDSTSEEEHSRAEVLVRDRGADAPRSRGTVQLEDLTEVLKRISSRTGPNGPQGPVTQYIVSEASGHLFDRLVGDIHGDEPLSAPRVLSALIGHEPFVENHLDLSRHHMRRRWPLASDWYADLISYVLRPKRYQDNEASVGQELGGWIQLPFGELVFKFADHQVKALRDPDLFRLPNTLYALWPEYEPIRKSYGEYRSSIEHIWIPLYAELLKLYRLALRPTADLKDVCWMFETIVTQAAKDVTLGWEVEAAVDRSTRALICYIAGAVQTSAGEFLSVEDLRRRGPGASDS